VKAIIPLGELVKKMNAISSVVPTRTTMPILSTVLISVKDDDIYFSATDLDISVRSKVSGAVEAGGSIAAPAKKVAEIVKSLSGDKVTFDVTDEKLTIQCGKSHFVVNGRKSEDFPKLPQQESKATFKIGPDLLSGLIQKTIYAVSTDLTRPALCGVLWEVAKDGVAMISTDGHRLAKVEVGIALGDIEKMSVIVPPKALSTFKAYAEGEDEITVNLGDNSVSFEMKESSIYSRLLEGPFPSYQKVIPEGNTKELVVGREQLADATKRVSILSDALTHQVVFALEKDKVTLQVTTQELGEATEEIEASFTDDPMQVGYNAAYIQDILRTMESDKISIMLDRSDNAGLIKPLEETEENIKQVCIVMPLRIG
jgi:DNA polymerase-3 subunit beta